MHDEAVVSAAQVLLPRAAVPWLQMGQYVAPELGAYLPQAHCLHVVCCATFWYVPGLHSTHAPVPPPEVPILHDLHHALPASGACFPSAQSVHPVFAPTSDAYWPIAQSLQLVAPVDVEVAAASLNLPPGQLMHLQSICLVPRNFPAGQMSSCGHVEHTEEPMLPNLPYGHMLQSDAEVEPFLPFALPSAQ